MYREQIEIEYQKFFNEFGVDEKSGESEKLPGKKFATYPYIGSKYPTAKKKILFVGLDIGKDETPGKYQTLADRNMAIESRFKDVILNSPHISGTYCSALYLLKEEYNWEDIWLEFSKYSTYRQATKVKHHRDGENPLSFVSLTNLHKFVTIGRKNRAGDDDRVHKESATLESLKKLLLKEIEILKPDVVLFQKEQKLDIISQIEELDIRVILAPHPANRKKGGMNPKNYTDAF